MSGTALITLNRPTAGNSLNLDLAKNLLRETQAAVENDQHIIVLSAEGPLFCAGGDVSAMNLASDPSSFTRELADTLHQSLLLIAQSATTLVAVVNGAAAGAGFGLVLNADYVIATPRAGFTPAYTALGVSPDGGTSFFLPRVVGKTRASELILAGRRLDAQTALEWGIVNELVAESELETQLGKFLSRLERVPAGALRASKRLLLAPWLEQYRVHLDLERDSIAELITSTEAVALQHTLFSKKS